MKKNKIKRENIMIAAGFVLTGITLAVSIFLAYFLSSSLNLFLFDEEESLQKEIVNFNFESYNALNF